MYLLCDSKYFKMDSNKYLEDLSEIKNLMNKSSRFISLSGLSGILAGVYALIGAFVCYFVIDSSYTGYVTLHSTLFIKLVIVLFLVALFSVLTAIILTVRKAKRNNESIWDDTSKRLIVNFLIPLVTGAIYILIKLTQLRYGHTASLMLLFYGLALINASKYSLGHVRYLGLVQILLGLICAALPGYGYIFWIIGFGLCHIIYGTIMHYTIDTKK